MSARAAILLLCDVRRHGAAQIRDHVNALRRLSRHRVLPFNPVGLRSCRLLDLEAFDAVVIHYSVFVSQAEYLSPALSEAVRRFRGPKIQFIQDDYRRVDERAAAARRLGVDVLFTLYPEADVPRVWGERLPGVKVVSTLAGYVPDHLVGRAVPPLERRSVEVGYRGREMPWWLGRASVDKVRVGSEFLARARARGLACDIRWDEESRLYGDEWERFVAGCRTVLGTESGATITDFDGSVEAQVRSYLARRPEAGFDEVSRAVLAPYEGKVPLLVISARMFEAAVLRTPMILFPGRYSGVLEAERHYILLEEDFSNFDTVAGRVRDLAFLKALADRVYEEIVRSGRHSHRVMVREFDRLVDEELAAHAPRAAAGAVAPLARNALAWGERWVWPDRPVSRSESLGRDVVRSAVALDALARRPGLRRLLARWRRVRRPGGLLADSHFAADVIRLEALRQMRAAASGPPLDIRFDAPSATLRVESRPCGTGPAGGSPAAALAAVASGAVRKIVWDHSAVGTSVGYAGPLGVPLRFQMEADGRYSFRALAAIAERHPADAAAALRTAWEAMPR